jgi:hypothetical protein
MYNRWKVWTSITFAFIAGAASAEYVTLNDVSRTEDLPAWLVQRDGSEPEATLAQLRSDLSPRWPQNQ